DWARLRPCSATHPSAARDGSHPYPCSIRNLDSYRRSHPYHAFSGVPVDSLPRARGALFATCPAPPAGAPTDTKDNPRASVASVSTPLFSAEGGPSIGCIAPLGNIPRSMPTEVAGSGLRPSPRVFALAHLFGYAWLCPLTLPRLRVSDSKKALLAF